MQIYNIYKNNCTGINEQCLKNINGDFIGIETGSIYNKESHYSRPQLLAKIISVDSKNKTGMYHLEPGYYGAEWHKSNNSKWKQKYLGCIVTVEQSHFAYELPVYICIELNEFFSGNELELL